MMSRTAKVGVFGATAGLAIWLARPARRSSPSSRRRDALVAYLRDHLSGSDVAIRVVLRLASTDESADHPALFRLLAEEFEQERSVVGALLIQLGASGRSIKRAAGFASGTALSVTAGGQPGDPGLFRTLEGLSIGVQGKRCMWRALQALQPPLSTVHGMGFVELEAQAVRQWEAIEKRRRALVPSTFAATARKTE